MPELPEVETVRRGLAPTFVGGVIAQAAANRPDLRFPLPARFAERLTGRRVEALRRRAKYLLADLDSAETLVMHLGMSGSFRVEGELVGEFHHPRGAPGVHDHVEFDFASGARVVYNDPRRFGFMDIVATEALDRHPLFAALGVEPLGPDFHASALAAVLQGARTPLKSALLDQRRIAGLGNIYVCEALHRAKLSPLREAGSLKPAETRQARARHRRGAGGGGRRRRLDAARPPPDRRQPRLFPAQLCRLRPRRRRLRPRPLRRRNCSHRAERKLDVLVRGVPAVTSCGSERA